MRSKYKWIFTLLVALSVQFSFAQEKTVTGVVSDASGTLPGANVVVQGTKTSTQTDANGKYTIKAKVGDVLVFSFVNYTSATAKIGAANVYNAKLSEGKILENVVVTSMNVKRKADAITSTYTVVKADELNRASATNAVQALVGKVSGLQINTTNSSVGGDNRVVLRNARSITGNNQALVVIDGAISTLGTLQQIPPETVLSVNVMKGAQGAAVYGSDGVNGVIVVTTKKGGNDKFSVNIKSSIDISEIAYTPIRQMRYGQGWDGLHSNIENGSWGPEYDGSMQPVGMAQADGTFIMAPYVGNQDNIKDFFKNGVIRQNGINISGGSLDTGYVNFALNRLDNDFVVKGDELKRNSFLFKAGKKIGKFSIEGNIAYITTNIKQAETSLFASLLQAATNIPIAAFENSGNDHRWTVYEDNPYWLRDNQRQVLNNNNLAVIATLGYEFNKHFNVSYLANLRSVTNDDLRYRNEYVDRNAATYGFAVASTNAALLSTTDYRRVFYGDLLFNFDYMLTKDVSLKASLGNNIQDSYFKSNEVGGINFAIPGVYNISNVLNPYTQSQLVFDNDGGSRTLANRSSLVRKIGLFATADFGYKDYLFLNLTGRNDWSSLFNKDNNSFFYPSVGFSFVPTKAFDAIKDSRILNYMKIGGSITKVGNDSAVGAYGINQTGVTGIGYPFGSNSYVQQTRPTYANIKPEFVTTKEIFANFGFLKDRITLDLSYYISDTDDLITRADASNTAGYISVLDNVGSLQNKGYEIDLGFTPIKNADARGFRWDNKLNFATSKTTITSLKDGATSVSLRSPSSVAGIYADLGQEFPLIKGSQYLRDSMGRIIIDASGNPAIDANQHVLGKTTPDYIIGFSPSVSYRGVKLSATMDYRTGHQFMSYTKLDLSRNGSTIETAENRGGFIMPNSSYDYNGDGIYSANETNTNVVTGSGGTPNYINFVDKYYRLAGENFVLDATAFKLREVALSYSFAPSLIKATGLTALSVSINARNPLTLFAKQNRNYGDPEASETSGNAAGIDVFNARYPVQSSYGFSLNLTF